MIDVLDRVLDKGIVVDAWMRMSLAGIDLLTVRARMTVASIDTYMKYADTLAANTRGVKRVDDEPAIVPKSC